jgi:hypothetical protein
MNVYVTVTGIGKNWRRDYEMSAKEAEKRFKENNPKNGHHSIELFYGWGDKRNKTVDYYNF